MKIWFKSAVLIWLSLCLLACGLVVEPKATASPTPSPSRTRPSPPQKTPAASPTVPPSPTPAPRIDPDAALIAYTERPAWRALLGWPDECEEGFQRFEHKPEDAGGVVAYPVADGQYLAFVTCNIGPYWVEERVYWLDYRADPPAARALTVPELVQDDAPELGLHDVDVLHGAFPNYDPDTQTLTNLAAYRGLKDCGVFYKYHLEDARFVLDEARYHDCIDAEAPDPIALDHYQWPLVYPLPASVGPFRKVARLDLPASDWDTVLRAQPDGSLWLMTRAGYATFREGRWDTQFLDEGQTLVGVDADGRAWIFGQTGEKIYYRRDGGELTPADVGWTPVWSPLTLRGGGVLTDGQGRVWLATEQDVRVFDGGQWTIYTREAMGIPAASEEDSLTGFTLTYVESKQQMWVGLCDWYGEAGPQGGGARWFDGQTWHGAQFPETDGCVTAIAADAEGHVWLGMDQGIVQRFDQASGSWQSFTLPAPGDYRINYVTTLTVGPDGTPWALAALLPPVCGGASCDDSARTFHHFQDGAWVAVLGPDDNSEDSLSANSSLHILFDGGGTPWVFMGRAVYRVENNRLVEPPVAELYGLSATVDAAGQVWAIAQAENDEPALWVLETAAPTAGHVGPFRKVIPVTPDLQGETMRLEVLPDGDLRLLTTNGFALLHDGAWQPYLLAPSQRFIGADAAGRLWFFPEEVPDTIFYWDSTMADYGGSAFVHADAGWLPVDDPTTLTGRGVLTDDQGQVWLATAQDVRVFAGGRWTIFTRKTLGMPPAAEEGLLTEFTLTCIESRRQTWVGLCDWAGGPMGGGGVRWFDGQAWRGAQSPTASGCVTVIAADEAGRVWIGMDHGIVKLFDQTTGNWREFPLPEPEDYRRGYALTLSLDPEGDPWLLAALCGGASCDVTRALYHFQDGAWIEVAGLQDYAERLYQGPLLPVLFDATGTPWFFLGGAPFRIRDHRLEQSPAAELSVLDATTDAAGQLWLVARSGGDSPALWVLEPDQ